MKVNGNLYIDGTMRGITVSDSDSARSHQARLSFAGGFYISGSRNHGGTVVNTHDDTLQLYMEAPAVGNFFLDTDAPYGYTVRSVSRLLQSGTATIGFYLMDAASNKNGASMAGLDPLSVSSTKQVSAANTTVNTGQQIKMSITAVASAKQLRISVRATPS